MKSEKASKVFSCCGQYLVPTKAVADKKIICPRCGEVQKVPIKCPNIVIFKA